MPPPSPLIIIIIIIVIITSHHKHVQGEFGSAGGCGGGEGGSRTPGIGICAGMAFVFGDRCGKVLVVCTCKVMEVERAGAAIDSVRVQ